MAIGGAIAVKTKNPILALVGAFFSHFLFDAIPHNDYIYYYLNHWDFVYTSPVSLGILITGLIMLFLLGVHTKQKFILWAGGCIAALPDVISVFSQLLGISPTFFDTFSAWCHTNFDLGEYFYTTFEGGKLLPKTSAANALVNFSNIRTSYWGNIGWGLELVWELFVVITAILLIRKALPPVIYAKKTDKRNYTHPS